MSVKGHLREKRLFQNTILYFVGNFASKLLNIILVPIYMIYLNANSLGSIDLMLLLSSMIALLFSLDMTDAVYRYMLDADTEEKIKKVITNAVITYAVGALIFSCIYFPLNFSIKIQFGLLFGIHVVLANFSQFLQQVCRGLKLNLYYAVSGIIITFVQGISNVILIIFFKQGAKSMLIAPIFGSLCVITFLTALTKWHKHVKKSFLSISEIKKMAKYSMPMYIQVLLLWVIQNSGTYFLTYYTGETTASGIYAVANKFPTIINSLASIFLLAWQESAITGKNEEDAKIFYNNIYTKYFWLMYCSVMGILPLLRIYFVFVGNASYAEVWKYVPPLLITSLVNALATFIGTQFIVEKNTIKMVWTLIIPSAIALIFNLLFVKQFKIYAVIGSQFISYLVLLLMRKRLTYNIYKLQFKTLRSILVIIGGGLTCLLYYLTKRIEIQILTLIIWFMYNMIINQEIVKKMLMLFSAKLGKSE